MVSTVYTRLALLVEQLQVYAHTQAKAVDLRSK